MSNTEFNPNKISFVGPNDLLNRFFSDLKRVRSAKTLAVHQKRLQHLAEKFDPFADTMTNECQQIVTFYHLDDAVHDPFMFTNLMLKMLDHLEEKQRAILDQHGHS